MMAEALIFKAIAATPEIDFSFWALFVRATITVKIVILLLIGASFWAWSIIIPVSYTHLTLPTKA